MVWVPNEAHEQLVAIFEGGVLGLHEAGVVKLSTHWYFSADHETLRLVGHTCRLGTPEHVQAPESLE
jgi:hypothetical protein